MSAELAPPLDGSAEPRAWPRAIATVRMTALRVGALCIVELQKIRTDKIEVFTRSIQPALWLLVFGTTFSHLRAIPTGDVPYLDFLAPGVMAQAALFIAIFHGIQVIWERDSGVLPKLMVTPTPRAALVAAKAFAAGTRALTQVLVVIVVALALGVTFTLNPLRLLAAAAVVVVGTVFFCCLSIVIAGLALSRERMIGIGQAIMMPLFFASNALYPVHLMPQWLQVLAHVNPLTYEIDALRGLLVGTPARFWLDIVVLVGSTAVAITAAAALLGRLAR